MIRRIFLFTSACSILGLSVPNMQAAPADDAVQKLKTAVSDVLTVANSASSPSALAQKLGPVLDKHVSFEVMTKRAIGPGWKSFTPEQQKKATDLFAKLIIRTYSAKFTPGEKPVIDYLSAAGPAQGRVDVPTKMQYKGAKYSVSYRLEQSGSWMITDVIIEGVSLIANYRSQLDAQFKRGGAKAVINSLTQSLSKT